MRCEAGCLLTILYEGEGVPTVYFSCRDFGAKIQKVKKISPLHGENVFSGKGPFLSSSCRPSAGRGIGVGLGPEEGTEAFGR